MPRVTSMVVVGLDLWFNSDDHLPPHFHAEKSGAWEVRVRFLREPRNMIDVVYSHYAKRPSKAELKDLKQQAEECRAKLLAEWESKVNVGAPGADR